MTFKLKEVVNELVDFQLSNIHVVDGETHKLNPIFIPKIARAVNDGVLELHKRFDLKTGTIRVEILKDTYRYHLVPERQKGNRAKPGIVQYIEMEHDKLFPRSILKVESVKDCHGREYDINTGSCWSVTFPQDNILEIDPDLFSYIPGKYLTLKYRKAPRSQIVCEDVMEDWACIPVDLPYTHKQALTYFVASRFQTPIGFMENTALEGVNYARMYESECANLEALSLHNGSLGFVDPVRRGGWA
ncbi:hypothetical protein [Pseudomonas phage PJNP053]